MEDPAADLCSRCASIPWDHLEQKEYASFWRDEKPTLSDLQTSPCRLCRLIASAVLTRLVRHAHPQTTVIIAWDRKFRSGGDCLGCLRLWERKRGCIGELGLTTRRSVGEGATALSTVVSKRVDLALFRTYLEACEASHSSCKPESSIQLRNLRVIDCIDNTVVVAPRGCSFVALSYVWGGLFADSYVLGSPIAFPPTIEDAVRTTRELGYQYLWVDRYVRRHKYLI